MFSIRIRLAAPCALLGLAAMAAPGLLSADGGAPPLTLREAVARAQAQSPELAIFPLRLRAGQAFVDGAALRPAPEFRLELENAFGSGEARGLDAAEATFALSQVIELGGLRDRRVDAARQELDTLAVERAVARLDVMAEVGRRFVHVASDQKQLELTALATTLAEKTVTEVVRRVRAARSPAVEERRARIALARAQIEQEHAEHELLSSRRKLAALWGERQADDFGPVRADLFVLPALEDDEVLLRRLADGPDFLRFASEARQRDAEIRLAEARARASLTVSAGVRLMRESDDAAFVGGLSMPLGTARRARPAIDQARALREAVDGERHAAQVKAEASLFELVQELRHSLTEAEVLRDQVLPQMDAALEETEYAWRRGRYSYLEWNEAQRERIAVQRALIEAAANAHLFRIEIERLAGAAVPEPTDSGDLR